MNQFETKIHKEPARDVYMGVRKGVWLFAPYLIYRASRPFLPAKHPWSKRGGNPPMTYQHWCDGSSQLNQFMGAQMTLWGLFAAVMIWSILAN